MNKITIPGTYCGKDQRFIPMIDCKTCDYCGILDFFHNNFECNYGEQEESK